MFKVKNIFLIPNIIIVILCFIVFFINKPARDPKPTAFESACTPRSGFKREHKRANHVTESVQDGVYARELGGGWWRSWG